MHACRHNIHPTIERESTAELYHSFFFSYSYMYELWLLSFAGMHPRLLGETDTNWDKHNSTTIG